MPGTVHVSNQKVTIAASDSGTDYQGDGNTFTFAAGTIAVTVEGNNNAFTGATGPDTLSVTGNGTSVTSAHGSPVLNLTLVGDQDLATIFDTGTGTVVLNGTNGTLTAGNGAITVTEGGAANDVFSGDGNSTFIVNGTSDVVSVRNGNNIIAISGSNNSFAGTGHDTYVLTATDAAAAGPVIGSYSPGKDHINVLVNSASAPDISALGLQAQTNLSSATFAATPSAVTSTTRFVYDPASGNLSFIPLNHTASTETAVANVGKNLTLAPTDIVISNVSNTSGSTQSVLQGVSTTGTPASVPSYAYYYSDANQGTAPLDAVGPGSPSYLQYQHVQTNNAGVALATSVANVFMKGGDGNDAISVTSGQNVLDGGIGSNFLVGGTGNDTFFTDARGPGVVFNTLGNFHAGDAATLWGFSPTGSTYSWENQLDGAPGHQGATLQVRGTGQNGQAIVANIAFAGVSIAQAQGFAIVSGSVSAGQYLYIFNNGP